ncbi:Methyltransferase domain-containing protein [Algoriphagus locisalis]|uniref:Methyltransferase domain-containing protein n=1 Tax=Algoriphagus locisalis TaxID=305507 RepID=A0A1I6YDK0_9BACT|nr:methyltransferase domain-containing protein [Algoriphagus locisalis]SFT48573.1 Methyltransferase domain-containing protein [Algoriphagus locisalis]
MSFVVSLDALKLTDEAINVLYPIKMQKLSDTHWTPVDISKKAIKFLSEDGRKSVLDLGSGSGKFCLVAALTSRANIVGVEQRENLVQLSRKISKSLAIENLQFIHADLIDLDFSVYDSFFFFNAFEELVNPKDKLDRQQELDEVAHQKYIQLIRQKFESTPVRVRIVTYCGECEEIPSSFRLVKSENKGRLKYWEKSI